MSEIEFRAANVADIPTILKFTKTLALHEGRSDDVTVTEERLGTLLFGAEPFGQCFFACIDGVPVGSVLITKRFASYCGSVYLYIEDIIVLPEMRGKAIGKKMMRFLAQKAVSWQCDKMYWSAMRDNETAIAFYEKLGAEKSDKTISFSMDKEEMLSLAESAI